VLPARIRQVATALRVCLVLLGLSVASLSSPVFAASVVTVGFGSPESCTEEAVHIALRNAEAVGGARIEFACGPTPTTIVVGGGGEGNTWLPFRIPDNTTIEGGGLVTIDSVGFFSMFIIEGGSSVTLKNLVLVGNHMSVTIANEGNLDVKNCGIAGGATAIENSGVLTVKDSRFEGNEHELHTAGIYNFGTAKVEGTEFVRNKGSFTGAFANRGDMEVKNSTFDENSGEWGAGAGWNSEGAVLRIDNCRFSGNFGFQNGVVGSSGSLTIKNSVFTDNFNHGPGAGAIESYRGSLSVENSYFFANSGLRGGAIRSRESLTLSNSILAGNFAHREGGALYLSGTAVIVNSTITENVAEIDGGGVFVLTPDLPTLTRTTIAGNSPNNIAYGF